MKLLSLLSFLLLATLLCSASDQRVQPPVGPSVSWSGTDSYESAPLLDKDVTRWNRLTPGFEANGRDTNSCLMLRTYIVVREDRNSDVTYRDGYVTCQPAWKFKMRTAVGTPEDR